jgi:hypothetical protein
MFEIINIGCKSVDQHWDNEFRSGYIRGIESDVIAAKAIEVKRVKNSIFISLINMVKQKNINIYLRRCKKFLKKKNSISVGKTKNYPF